MMRSIASADGIPVSILTSATSAVVQFETKLDRVIVNG
jgi:hypothetical protein